MICHTCQLSQVWVDRLRLRSRRTMLFAKSIDQRFRRVAISKARTPKHRNMAYRLAALASYSSPVPTDAGWVRAHLARRPEQVYLIDIMSRYGIISILACAACSPSATIYGERVAVGSCVLPAQR